MKGKYHITYHLEAHPEGIEKSAVPENHGASDAVIIASVIHGEQSTSYGFVSLDGRTAAPLDDRQLFMIWAMLAAHLTQSATLSPGPKALCAELHERIKASVLAARGIEPS